MLIVSMMQENPSEPQSYKISAFHSEDRITFPPFYNMAETLKHAIRFFYRWSESGVNAELLKNIVQSVKKLTPEGPFKHKVTEEYVQSMLNICEQSELLSAHLSLDQTQTGQPMHPTTGILHEQVSLLCDQNDQLLKAHYLAHDRHNLANNTLSANSRRDH